MHCSFLQSQQEDLISMHNFWIDWYQMAVKGSTAAPTFLYRCHSYLSGSFNVISVLINSDVGYFYSFSFINNFLHYLVPIRKRFGNHLTTKWLKTFCMRCKRVCNRLLLPVWRKLEQSCLCNTCNDWVRGMTEYRMVHLMMKVNHSHLLNSARTVKTISTCFTIPCPRLGKCYKSGNIGMTLMINWATVTAKM